MAVVESTDFNWEKAAKIVGILVALIGCFVGILSYLRGSRSNPAEEDAKVRQQMLGTWFGEKIFSRNNEDIDWIQRLDLSSNGNATTTVYYYFRSYGSEEPLFFCTCSFTGGWSVQGKVWSVRRSQTSVTFQPYWIDGREVPQDYRDNSGINCNSINPITMPETSELRIQSISDSTLEVTDTQADRNGEYQTVKYTRKQPYLFSWGGHWYSSIVTRIIVVILLAWVGFAVQRVWIKVIIWILVSLTVLEYVFEKVVL